MNDIINNIFKEIDEINPNRFTLPGANEFSAYLLSKLGDTLFFSADYLSDGIIGKINHGDTHSNPILIGIYSVTGVRHKAEDFNRYFQGNIPGFKQPINLDYRKNGKGTWTRNDSHNEIPFP